LLSAEPLFGTFLGLGSALAAEACAMAGFEWLLVDLEHGAGGEEALLGQLLAAAAHDVPAFVRVETAARVRIGRVLDLGAAGVMLPRMDSASQVAAALRYLQYPPDGERGVATYTRACWFGLQPDYLDRANDDVVNIVQVESIGALNSVEEIAKIGGVHVLFVGPRDLTHALGIPGLTGAPEYVAALGRVRAAAHAAGIAAGVLAADEYAAQQYAEQGFTFIGIGSDAALLARGASTTVTALRPASISPRSDEPKVSSGQMASRRVL